MSLITTTKKIVFSTILLAIIMLNILPAAGQREEMVPSGTDSRTITDSLGREITLSGFPERIVIAGRAALITADALYLFPGMSERVIAIGQTNQGLGDLYPVLDPDLENKKRLPHGVSAEEVAALGPDLVVVKDSVFSSLGAQLERLGIPVLALNLESPAHYARDIRIIGDALGNLTRAEEIVSIFERKQDLVQQKVTPLEEQEKPRTLLLYHTARDGEIAFNISPDSWIQTFQVEKAGGRAVWKGSNAGSGWQKVNFEQIAAWNPDVIYVTAFNSTPKDFLPAILEAPQWKELDAYKNGRVKAVPADFHSWAQPDTRWIIGLEWMAADLHPDLFPDKDILRLTRDFFTELYGISQDQVERIIIPRVRESIGISESE